MTGDPVEIEVGPYRLTVAVGFGPRLTGLRRDGGPEILAVLDDDIVIDHPDSGVFTMRGGHRLWAAPEVPFVTYSPDDGPCLVSTAIGRVTVTGTVDRAGLIKEISVAHEHDGLLVGHELTNAGEDPITVAPWAITQVPLSGRAILPVGGEPGAVGPVASRSIALWPYTDLADPRLAWSPRSVVISADAGPPLKLGSGPRPVRLGYLREGFLFTKELPPAGDGEGPDRGAVAQVYVNDLFCELESLGSLTTLDPGDSVSHHERWFVERCDDPEDALERVTEGVSP